MVPRASGPSDLRVVLRQTYFADGLQGSPQPARCTTRWQGGMLQIMLVTMPRRPELGPLSNGGAVIKTALTVTKVVVAATFILAGYVFLTSLPDLRRYIKISTM